MSLNTLKTGDFLFKSGDTDDELVYLIDGEIKLQTEEFEIETISADSESAVFAIAHQIPRKVDAISATDIRFLRIKPDMIKSAQQDTYNKEGPKAMVVEESEDSNDWMTSLLKSPIFRVLPPANLQKILMRLEEVNFKPGDTIISQDSSGDYYYMIKNGHCLLTRKPSPNAKEIKLGELKTLDTFGEDSLISGEPRNVTVRAVTESILLRLHKDDFIDLIKTPALRFVDHIQAKEHLARGAILIDVRSADEFQQNHLEGSVNIPFFSLRMHLKNLPRKKPVLVVCADGKTSEAAAFLLLRNRITAFILRGGVDGNNHSKASFSIDEGIETNIAPFNKEITAIESTDNHDSMMDPEQESADEAIARLNMECRQLKEERDEWCKKYKALSKQTDKLKQILETLRPQIQPDKD